MTAKSPPNLEHLWDIEDQFGVLIGTAIGTVYPVLVKDTPRRKERAGQSAKNIARLKKADRVSRATLDRAKSVKSATRPSGADWISEDSRCRDAIYDLCSVYWRPIFSFIQRRGHSVWDAQDLTQDFFLTVLEGKLFSEQNVTQGRFRPMLLNSLKKFLSDAKRKNKPTKRMDVQFVSWGSWVAESPSTMVPPRAEVAAWTAERTFDVRWAATIVERALRQLAEEYTVRGQRKVFEVLSDSLTAERSDIDFSGIAQELSTTQPASKSLLHHLRLRYRTLLRREVAETVERRDQVDEEIRYLCRVLSGADKETREPRWNKWLSAQRKALAAIQAELWGKAHLPRVTNRMKR